VLESISKSKSLKGKTMDELTEQGLSPDSHSTGLELTPGMFFQEYRIIELLGQGGAGVVYLAEQGEPVKRKVAIKLLRNQLLEENGLLRFQMEMQLLAQMDHSYIARIYKVGVFRGTPFFAMEYVQGKPVVEFCDEQKLSIGQRLILFQNILDSVQHAHQQGVIHRDIKPSNILVKMEGGRPVPKLIDFGIAKAVVRKEDLEKSLTIEGGALGTPSYMSPEQFEGSLQVDTRSDIYALGVVLHQLLVGVLPVDFKNQPFYQALKTLFEGERHSLNKKYESTRSSRTEIARKRATLEKDLALQVRGDLNLMVQKAIARNRDDRYATALAFKQDISNYLENRPLDAHAPGKGYQFRKFIQRHWLGTLATSLVLLALILGISGTTYQYFLAKEAREKALLENEKSKEVLRFMANMLASPQALDKGKDIKVIEILDDALNELQEQKDMNPHVECSVRSSLSQTYGGLGEFERAQQIAEEGLQRVEPVLGGKDPDVLNLKVTLAETYWLQGEFNDAERLLREIIGIQKSLFSPGNEDLLSSKNDLAGLLWEKGDYKDALKLIEDVYLSVREKKGPTHSDTLVLEGNYASALLGAGYVKKGRQIFRDLIQHQRQLDPVPYGHYLENRNTLAVSFLGDQPEKAIALQKETLKIARKEIGKDPLTFNYQHNLGYFYHHQGAWSLALKYYEMAYQDRMDMFGLANYYTRTTEGYYLTVLFYSGALEEMERILDRREKEGWDNDPEYALNFARNCLLSERVDRAESLFREYGTKVGTEHNEYTIHAEYEWKLLARLVESRGDPDTMMSLMEPDMPAFQEAFSSSISQGSVAGNDEMNYSIYKNEAWYKVLFGKE